VSKPLNATLQAKWRARKNERQRIRKSPLTVDPRCCAENYNLAFPSRPPLASTAEWLTGAWAIGACWKNPNPLHGAYPRGYLQRVHAIFPSAKRVLHAFSGGLTVKDATADLSGDVEVELVDVKGQEDGRFPTWCGDVLAMPEDWAGRFDLVLADPPYSQEDAAVYGTPMPRRSAVMSALRRVTASGGHLVWLDLVWPMHRKDEWRCWGHIAVVRSTNHRVRLASFFEAVGEQPAAERVEAVLQEAP